MTPTSKHNLGGSPYQPTPPLRIAQLVANTDAEGPGRRFAVWVQGCRLRCAGCCNPEMFSPTGGRLIAVATLVERIRKTPDIEGISLLGGEPLQQARASAALVMAVREVGLTTMVYSGYSLEEIEAFAEQDSAVKSLIGATDVLVDGRYDASRPEPHRRWIGSSNQRLHFLSERYHRDDPRFVAPNAVEIRFDAGQLVVNGWPAAADAIRAAIRHAKAASRARGVRSDPIAVRSERSKTTQGDGDRR